MAKVGRWLGGKLESIRTVIDDVFGHDMHAKRDACQAGCMPSGMHAKRDACQAGRFAGQGDAGYHDHRVAGGGDDWSGAGAGLATRHAIKQVDRMLSNQKIDVRDSFAHWVPS